MQAETLLTEPNSLISRSKQWVPRSIRLPPPALLFWRHAPSMGGYQHESWARAKTGVPILPSAMICFACWCNGWKPIM